MKIIYKLDTEKDSEFDCNRQAHAQDMFRALYNLKIGTKDCTDPIKLRECIEEALNKTGFRIEDLED